MTLHPALCCCSLALLLLAACGDDASGTTTAEVSTGAEASTGADESTGAASLEIVGQWYEALSPDDGITHVITETTWEQQASFGDSLYHIDSFDNEARWVVARGDASNEFFPDLYSRFDWTWDSNVLYYCTAAFDAATPEDALGAAPSNPDDLETGCSGFPWSSLLLAP